MTDTNSTPEISQVNQNENSIPQVEAKPNQISPTRLEALPETETNNNRPSKKAQAENKIISYYNKKGDQLRASTLEDLDKFIKLSS